MQYIFLTNNLERSYLVGHILRPITFGNGIKLEDKVIKSTNQMKSRALENLSYNFRKQLEKIQNMSYHGKFISKRHKPLMILMILSKDIILLVKLRKIDKVSKLEFKSCFKENT